MHVKDLIKFEKLQIDKTHWIKTVRQNVRDMRHYLTKMNGGSPYCVWKSKDTIYVYAKDKNKLVPDAFTENWFYTLLVHTIKKPVKTWIGMDRVPRFKGNSILVQTGKNKYTAIGGDIFEFTTNEPIKSYWSIVGNSSVPYPVALGAKFVYFIFEKTYTDRANFAQEYDWSEADPYDLDKACVLKLDNLKILHREF
jgi:hypothetical protein